LADITHLRYSEPAGAIRIGTAGWSIPKAHAAAFGTEGTHLQRYAAGLDAVEINSSFYRSHKPDTYARWAASVPHGFRFAVKMPRAITHEQELRDADDLLDRFLGEIRGLGEKLGPVLVQLPPRLRFDAATAGRFFAAAWLSASRGTRAGSRQAPWPCSRNFGLPGSPPTRRPFRMLPIPAAGPG
jgi:uncharacterized protein YecE (DUF72 family)